MLLLSATISFSLAVNSCHGKMVLAGKQHPADLSLRCKGQSVRLQQMLKGQITSHCEQPGGEYMPMFLLRVCRLSLWSAECALTHMRPDTDRKDGFFQSKTSDKHTDLTFLYCCLLSYPKCAFRQNAKRILKVAWLEKTRLDSNLPGAAQIDANMHPPWTYRNEREKERDWR